MHRPDLIPPVGPWTGQHWLGAGIVLSIVVAITITIWPGWSRIWPWWA